MRRTTLAAIMMLAFAGSSTILAQEGTALSFAKPTPDQAAWHDCEIGMFIHFAPNTWTDREYDDLSLPLEKINPEKLDTDQWAATAEAITTG